MFSLLYIFLILCNLLLAHSDIFLSLHLFHFIVSHHFFFVSPPSILLWYFFLFMIFNHLLNFSFLLLFYCEVSTLLAYSVASRKVWVAYGVLTLKDLWISFGSLNIFSISPIKTLIWEFRKLVNSSTATIVNIGINAREILEWSFFLRSSIILLLYVELT